MSSASGAGKAGGDLCCHEYVRDGEPYAVCDARRRDHAGYLDDTFPPMVTDHAFDEDACIRDPNSPPNGFVIYLRPAAPTTRWQRVVYWSLIAVLAAAIVYSWSQMNICYWDCPP